MVTFTATETTHNTCLVSTGTEDKYPNTDTERYGLLPRRISINQQ